MAAPKPVTEQSRAELVAEFSAFLKEARRRGDNRNGAQLIAEWYAWRREQG